jgi:hypothetical protein
LNKKLERAIELPNGSETSRASHFLDLSDLCNRALAEHIGPLKTDR